MPTFVFPIPSPVPLSVLAMSIGDLRDRTQNVREYSRSVRTRFGKCCEGNHIKAVWQLAFYTRGEFGELTNAGPVTMALAEELLGAVNCQFAMFTELRTALTMATMSANQARTADRSGAADPVGAAVNVFDMLRVLGGYYWATEEPRFIVNALNERDLRQDMPLEELFVYDSSLAAPAEPKELTVAQEVAAFLGARITDLWSGTLPGATETLIHRETRVGECAVIVLAARKQPTQHVTGLEACEWVLIRLARQHLSPEALARLGM